MTDEIIEEVKAIKDHLKELAPNAIDIKIDVEKQSPSLYQSKIKVKLPRRKPMFALKRSFDPFSSLFKGHQAILKQLFKEKTKRKKVKHPLVAA